MTGERCNLDKDEAELLKLSSSPTSSSPPPPPPIPQSLHLTNSQVFPPQVPEKPVLDLKVSPDPEHPPVAGIDEASPPPIRRINRCSTCGKGVRLAGYRCRCGELFCGRHRHAELHECSFDYKSAGREKIVRNNPVIRAAKILKI